MTKIPIYTTRQFGPHGKTGQWAIENWVFLPALYLALANVIGWGIYGLVELVGKVV